MAIETKLHLLGLHTAPNVIDPRAQAGTFEIADNVVIDQPNLLEPRKGFERLRAYTGMAARMFVHDPDGEQRLIIVLENGQLWEYEEINSTWQRLSSADIEGTSTEAVIPHELVMNLPETLTPAYINNATFLNDAVMGPIGRFPQRKGFAYPNPSSVYWDISNYVNSPYLLIGVGKEMAAKAVIVHTMPDGSEVRSAPSPTFWIRRPSAGTGQKVRFQAATAYLYPGYDGTTNAKAAFASQRVELYRTAEYPIDTAPPTDFYLVTDSEQYKEKEYSVLSATYEGNATGAALYTNAGQGGASSTPRKGATSKSVEGYGGTLFLGAVKDVKRVVYRFNQYQKAGSSAHVNGLLRIDDATNGLTGLTVTLKALGESDVVLHTWAFADGLENALSNRAFEGNWLLRTGEAALSLNDRWKTASRLMYVLNKKLPAYGFEVEDLNGHSEDTVGYFALRTVPTHPEADKDWQVEISYQYQGGMFAKDAWVQEDFVPVTQRTGGEFTLNEVAFSAPFEPGMIPLSNTFRVGDGEILGMKALREALLVFCSDGIFRVTGTNPQYFVEKIDNSAILLAPKSLAVLDNQVIAYTTQGVVAVDSVGVKILSSNIAETFQANYTVHTNNAKASTQVGQPVERSRIFKEAFGATDDVLRRYYLSIPNTFSGGSAMFVYSATTTAWTKWTINAKDGVNNGSKFTYLDPTYPLVYRQKKFYTDYDYSDQQQGFTTLAHGIGYFGAEQVSDIRVTAGMFAQYSVGDGVEALGKTFVVREKINYGSGTTPWALVLDRWEPAFNAGGGDACIFHKAITTKIKYNPIMEADPAPLKQWVRGLFFFKTPLMGTGTVTVNTDVNRTGRSHEISSYRDLHTGGRARTEAIRLRGIRGGRLSLELEIRQAFTPYELEGVSLTARTPASTRFRRK